MRAPLVEAKQDSSIRVQDLAEVLMRGSRFWQAKQRLVPLEAAAHIGYPDDRPRSLHGVLLRPKRLMNELRPGKTWVHGHLGDCSGLPDQVR